MTSAASRSPPEVLAALARRLPGLAAQGAPEALAPFRIGSRLPEALAVPATAEQVGETLALAHREGWGVVPWGAGRDMAAGREPARYQLALSLAGLTRVIEHDAENLTLTAQAGLPLAEANRQVRGARQFVPLGHAGDARTLGGLVAANRPVARRLLYGDVRDQLLGLRVAMPDGRLVRFGRKVVKNVAGYDMGKLFTGCGGMLGAIVEVTLKLCALPDQSALAAARFGSAAQAAAAAGELYRSRLAPAQIVLLDGAGARACLDARAEETAGLCWLAAGFEGRAVGVRRQTADALAAMARHGGAEGRALPDWTPQACAWLDAPAPQGAALRLRLGSAPASLVRWAQALSQLAGARGMRAALAADFGGGWLRASLTPGASRPDPEALAAALHEMRASLEQERGYLVLEAAPAPVMERIGPWGALGGETAVMNVLRRQLDPKEILAPGRFL